MKKQIFIAVVTTVSLFCMQLMAFAEEETAEAKSLTLSTIGSYLGYFLLIMAIIYGALHLTIWIGKKFGKH